MIPLLTLLVASYAAAPGPGSRFSLEVEKTGLMKGKKHIFRFAQYRGALQYDPQSPAGAHVEFTLAAASMICEDDWVKPSDRAKILAWGLDKMIRVTQHPEIRFVSTKVTPSGANQFSVAGVLTIAGVTNPAIIAVTTRNQQRNLEMNGNATINMKNWGMTPPSAALGTVGTRPEMQVRFQLFFIQSK